MNKYIIEILQNRSSLILPGIGALMITNKKTGVVKFNQHLTFNDGALAAFIAEKENIDKTEAQNMVSKFTREIKNQLDKGESYDIFEFGKIFKNEKGEVSFEMVSDAASQKKSSLSETLDKKEAKPKPTAEAKKEIKAKSKPVGKKEEKPKVASVTDKKEVKPQVEKATPQVEKKVVEEPKPIEKQVESVKNTYTPPKKDIEPKDKKEEVIIPAVPKISGVDSKKPEVKVEEKKTVIKEKQKEPKKRKKWPIIVIILALIITPAIIFKDKLMTIVGLNQTSIKNVNNYPDADNDGIPDFADVDLTKGNDTDYDGIDDLADLDQTNGKDEDHDGIDDAFAAIAMATETTPDTPIDITVPVDKNGNDIPDFAEIANSEGLDGNENGIDDAMEFTEGISIDDNGNGVNDSLENIAVLNQINDYLSDENNNGLADYVDVEVTLGEDLNKNGLDDKFENPEQDLNDDGIFDSLQLVQAHIYSGYGDNDLMDDNAASAIVEEEISEEVAATEEEITPVEETEIVETEPIVEERPTSEPRTSSNGNYHIIGGAFEIKSNAENFAAKMQGAGFSPHIVGRFDGLYLVALNSYNSREEAGNALGQARSTSSSAWVFKH